MMFIRLPTQQGCEQVQWKKKDIIGLLRKNPNQIAVRQPRQQMLFKSTDIHLLSPGASVNL